MSEVFLSYSRQDQVMANHIATAIENHGGRVFKDMALVAGDDLQNQIEDAIGQANVVVVLLSKNVSSSKWLKHELVNALEQKKRIIPVLLGSNAKDNYVWSLVADRQPIEIEDTLSPAEIGEKVADILSTIESAPNLYGLKA